MGFFGGGGAAPANMVGATSSVAGTAGLVPAPAAGNNTRALFSDATFGELPLRPQYKPSNSTMIPSALTNAQITISGGPASLGRYFVLMYAPVTGNIDTLIFRTGGTGFNVAQNVNLACWKCGQDGLPSDYIIGANVSSGTATATNVSVAVASTEIKRGFFFMSFTASGSSNAGALSGRATDHSFISVTGYNNSSLSLAGQQNMHYYVCATAYDQTTHETFTIQTTLQAQPNVGFEYA